jgi:DNA-binding PadR family transcriptional regulator
MSTTGYAVLGLLALRPLTPYELTQQMLRSLDYCLPTSERTLYDQPDRLVAAGLAEVTNADADPSHPRRYGITEAGRAALRGWLAADAAMPRFQNEPLLRVLLADQGSVDDLHHVLASLRAHIATRRELGLAQLEPYVRHDGLFQDRAHIVAIVGDLISRLLVALDEWAADVLELSRDWTTTVDVGLDDEVRAVLERVIASEVARLAGDA